MKCIDVNSMLSDGLSGELWLQLVDQLNCQLRMNITRTLDTHQ